MATGRIGGFASAALAQLGAREWRGLALWLFVLLTATQAVLALHVPAHGAPSDPAFNSATAIRAIGLLSIAVALQRVATGSPRKKWGVDGGFWLFFALSLIEMAIEAVVALVLRPDNLLALLVIQASAILLFAPFAVWTVAAAVEKPLAWPPGRYFRDIGRWLPPLLALLLPVVLLATVHAYDSLLLTHMQQAQGFWPLVVVDGLVSTLVVLAELSLRLTAYRLVARD